MFIIEPLPFYDFQAFCEEGNIEENGVLSFAKFVIFPILSLQGEKGKLLVDLIRRKFEYLKVRTKATSSSCCENVI